MKSKKILFLSTQMEAGGVQIRSTRMLKALRSEGHDVRLVFLYTKRNIFEGAEGVFSLFPSKPKNLFDLLLIIKNLIKYVLDMKPDVIVGFAHYSSPLAAIVGIIAGVPRRIGTQTNPPSSVGLAGRALDWICGVFGLYTANIAASEAILDCFHDYPASYRKRLIVVRNGVDWVGSDISKSQARMDFNIPDNVNLIVNCGRLSYQKNQQFLLDILSIVPDVHLAILGEGELRGEIEAKVAGLGLSARVTLVGEIAPARVPDFLAAGDVFVFPSHYEAFGLALAEAMLAGLPVIAHDEPALREVVGSAGALLPLTEVEAWARTVENVLGDPTLARSMSAASSQRGRAFSFESMLGGFKAAMFH